MAFIITTYTPDGKKIRKPVGYVGGQCGAATKPYEDREIRGQTKKSATPEAYQPEPSPVEVDEKTKIGG